MATMKRMSQLLATALVGVGISAGAQASAYITNGLITMGVNDQGHLNVGTGASGPYPGVSVQGTAAVGLRYNAPTGGSYASTEPGCLCEGWGVGLVSSGTSGYANVATDGGVHNLSLVSFASTASTATSIVTMGGKLEITHFYHPSAVANLYQVDVSIKNISGAAIAASDIVYRRVMDWDVEPTAFSEYVTIAGVPGTGLGLANGSNLRHTGDNGFNTANPLVTSGLSGSGCAPADTNFTKCGPSDHGALFDFEFEALADGSSRSFTTYYGAAGNETDALAALSAVGAGIYSTAFNNLGGVPGTTGPAVFMYGFGSRSGGVLDPVDPGHPTPEPGSLALAGLALAGLAGMRRRKSA